jgi:hypothetical protein
MTFKCVAITGCMVLIAGCGKVGNLSTDPAKSCVSSVTMSKILDILVGDGGPTSHLHRTSILAQSSDAVLLSYDKTTKLITCRGTIEIEDKEHQQRQSTLAVWTIQPTADSKSMLYGIPRESVGDLRYALSMLESAAAPPEPYDNRIPFVPKALNGLGGPNRPTTVTPPVSPPPGP